MRMKTILYMAMTANGLIAREDDSTPWSDAEWQAYAAKCREMGSLVIGRRTYELMREDDTFARLGNPEIVVVTRGELTDLPTGHLTAGSPTEALDLLSARGHATALVGGGTELNTAFLAQGLIDEIYLDVEPVIFSRGIPLVLPSMQFELGVTLVGHECIGSDTLQLHYVVRR
jgi:dihydrofolate reductase